MENAADALKMVLGMFMFVLGLSVFFYMTNQVRATSDIVLFESDKTNFYNMDKLKGINTDGNRQVGIDAIIPNVYRYYTENIGITIIDKNNSSGLKFVRYSTSDDARVGVEQNVQQSSTEYNNFEQYFNDYILSTDKMGIKTLIDNGTITENDIWQFYKNQYGNGTDTLKPAIWKGGTIEDDRRIKRVYADVTGKTIDIDGIGTMYTGIDLQNLYGNKTFNETYRETIISETKTGTIDTKKKESVIEIIYIAN